MEENNIETMDYGKYFRVGDDYYTILNVPSKNGKTNRVLAMRSKTTITDDFGKKYIDKIKKYNGFVLFPEHTNYRQEIGGFFNRYYPLEWKPTAGNCDNIFKIIRHIFGNSYYDFALDWLQLLYLKPTQSLPIIILESEARNTGKSTFAEFALKIFGYNGVKLGQNDIESDFNAIWVERLVIVIDESNMDKKSITELLKRYSTEQGKVVINRKNVAQYESDFFGKFLLCSNNVGKTLFIPKGEIRFAVFNVPTLAEDDPYFLQKLEREIPAFLYFLQNRSIVHKEKSRMWFDFSVYHTSELNNYYRNSVAVIAQEIERVLCDSFAMFTDKNELFFALMDLADEMTGIKYANTNNIKNALINHFEMKEPKQQRYEFYSLKWASNSDDPMVFSRTKNGKPYMFRRKDFEE